MTRNQIRVGTAALAGCALLLAAAPAMAQGTAAFKCSGAISKASTGIANFVEKFVTKCTNDYVKRSLFLIGEKGKGPDALFKSGELCQKFVNDKALAALSSKAVDTSACDDGDLAAIGHLPTSATGGPVYAGLVALDALRSGLRAAANTAPDLWAIMEAVGGLSTTPCTACETLRNALFNRQIGPCAGYSCTFAAGTSVTANTAGGPIVTTVTGGLVADICRYEDALAGAYGLFAGPLRTVRANVGGLIDVCVDSPQSKGYILDGAGTIANVEVCQDHVIEGGTDECVTTGVSTGGFDPSECAATATEGNCSTTTTRFCNEDSDCPASETCDLTTNPVETGGACARLASVAGGSGDALIQQTLINTVLSSGTLLGPDGVACTADDTAPPGVPVQNVLTTGTAEGIVYDANRVDGTTIAPAILSGSPFVVSGAGSLEDGTLDATLVGVFPALSVDLGILGIQDLVTTISLNCD